VKVRGDVFSWTYRERGAPGDRLEIDPVPMDERAKAAFYLGYAVTTEALRDRLEDGEMLQEEPVWPDNISWYRRWRARVRLWLRRLWQ